MAVQSLYNKMEPWSLAVCHMLQPLTGFAIRLALLLFVRPYAGCTWDQIALIARCFAGVNALVSDHLYTYNSTHPEIGHAFLPLKWLCSPSVCRRAATILGALCFDQNPVLLYPARLIPSISVVYTAQACVDEPHRLSTTTFQRRESTAISY